MSCEAHEEPLTQLGGDKNDLTPSLVNLGADVSIPILAMCYKHNDLQKYNVVFQVLWVVLILIIQTAWEWLILHILLQDL